MIGAAVAIAGAIVQAIALASNGNFIENLGAFVTDLLKGRFDQLPLNELVGLLILVIGFGTFFTIRYTSFLVKESQEPFRYTFWIEPFRLVTETPDKRISLAGLDRFHLLHHDLRERINQRITRFSLLEVKDSDSKRLDLASHVHVRGDFAVREDEDEKWVIQVMPRVMIGPPGSPETLAYPVKYLLSEKTGEGEKEEDNVLRETLDADRYNQIVERVYSSIATEVYRQILSDVKGKLLLFPTNYLRYVALFYEAKDFERSNTVDAYDYALELYREAERYFEMRFLGRIDSFLLKIPLLWRLVAKSQLMEARARIGYSRCLTYRRSISTLSGRRQNTLFETESELERAAGNLIELHNQINRKWKIEKSSDGQENQDRTEEGDRYKTMAAFLTFPNDSALRRDRPIFDRQRHSLFDAFTVGALAYAELSAVRKAERFLENAKAVDPDLSQTDPLWLLAAAEIQPDLDGTLFLLRRATEMAPDFEIAQYRLANFSEMRLRARNEIGKDRVQSVIEEYDEVLRINPGNTGALAAQGYLSWLLEELEEARKKFEEGRELKASVRQTFIGEFNYGLARVAAEKGEFNKSYDLYQQAIADDPGVGAYSAVTGSRVISSYYAYVGQQMLQRYEEFRKRVEKRIQEHSRGVEAGTNDERQVVSEKTLKTVHSFVLNDFGNAYLNYFHRSGDLSKLKEAILAYEEAIREYSENAVAYWNLDNAYAWEDAVIPYGSTDRGQPRIENRLEKAERLAPSWPIVIAGSAKSTVESGQRLVQKLKEDKDKAEKDLERKRKDLETRTSDQLEERREQPLGQGAQTRVQQADVPAEEPQELTDLRARIEELDKELANQHGGLVKAFKNYIDKIINQTKFISPSEGSKIEYDGKGSQRSVRDGHHERRAEQAE